ncbi:MAG: hypothetical protein K6E86_04370 [Bacteroidales bacterium]|nr:hypothetical protein [Bacteroidales bacterium]
MKKFFSLLASSVIIAAGFTACGEDDATYTPVTSNIKITSTAIDFTALGGEGYITYTSSSAITYDCDAEWVSVSEAEQGKLTLTVAKNYELDGRVAIVTLSDKQGDTEVSVIQQGVTQDYSIEVTSGGEAALFYTDEGNFPAINIPSDSAGTFAFGIEAPMAVEFAYDADWLSVSASDDSIYVTVTDNETGHIRQTQIAYECGAKRDAIVLTQSEPSDLYGLGIMTYKYVEGDKVKDSVQYVYITAKGIAILDCDGLDPNGGSWLLPATINEGTADFTFSCPGYVGDYGGVFDIYALAVNSKLNPVLTSSSDVRSAIYDAENGCSTIPVSFGSGYLGFALGAFTQNKPVNENNYQGPAQISLLPCIYRLDPSSEAAPARVLEAAKAFEAILK